MQLYLGDCLIEMAKIPDNSINCIVTDPPYRVISGGQTKTASTFYKGGDWKNDGKIFIHNDFKFTVEFLDLLYQKMVPQSHIYWFTNFLNLSEFLVLFEKSKFRTHNLLVWDKGNKGFVNRWYRKNAEYIILGYKGKARRIYNPSSATIHRFNLPKFKEHPTEKPTELLEYYIQNSTLTGETVFDPFMGSGSTGVACINTSRNFIGIEKDEKYFEIAKSRIEKNQIPAS